MTSSYLPTGRSIFRWTGRRQRCRRTRRRRRRNRGVRCRNGRFRRLAGDRSDRWLPFRQIRLIWKSFLNSNFWLKYISSVSVPGQRCRGRNRTGSRRDEDHPGGARQGQRPVGEADHGQGRQHRSQQRRGRGLHPAGIRKPPQRSSHLSCQKVSHRRALRLVSGELGPNLSNWITFWSNKVTRLVKKKAKKSLQVGSEQRLCSNSMRTSPRRLPDWFHSTTFTAQASL